MKKLCVLSLAFCMFLIPACKTTGTDPEPEPSNREQFLGNYSTNVDGNLIVSFLAATDTIPIHFINVATSVLPDTTSQSGVCIVAEGLDTIYGEVKGDQLFIESSTITDTLGHVAPKLCSAVQAITKEDVTGADVKIVLTHQPVTISNGVCTLQTSLRGNIQINLVTSITANGSATSVAVKK